MFENLSWRAVRWTWRSDSPRYLPSYFCLTKWWSHLASDDQSLSGEVTRHIRPRTPDLHSNTHLVSISPLCTSIVSITMASHGGDVLTLVMNPYNPANTTITAENGVVYYTSFTKHDGKTSSTEVRNSNNGVIASLEWRGILPDQVTFGRHYRVSIWRWMEKSFIPFRQ